MASKTNGIDPSGWARAPPPGTLRQRIARAIYNSEEKSFLGRTPKKWGIVLLFYIVFYIVLALLFTICMTVLLMQLEDDKPMYTLTQSLIGANPGVAFRPLPADGVILRYKVDNVSHYEGYINELSEFLAPYESESWYSAKKECKSEDNFGYPSTPCVYIKLNKIYGWKPEYYDDVATLPTTMPQDLRDYIEGLQPVEHQQIWISCSEEGSNGTGIEYPWGRGLPGRFYPYSNEKGYKSPLVAVKVIPPSNTEVIIRCWAWAKNILHSKSIKEPSGYTRIVLNIDDGTLN